MADEMQTSLSMDSEKMESYQRCVKEGKNAARQGDMKKSLELFKQAHILVPSQKLKSRIEMIEKAIVEMAQQGSESEDEEFVNVHNSGLMLFKELYDKLYEHQKEGIAFLYGLHRDRKKGGILADDMGLGKTIQIIAFLSGMYDSELVKHTLLVMPTSLIGNWMKEFAKWTPGMRVKEFHGTSKAERNRNLEKIQRRGGVIITTYQMLITNWELLASHNGQEFRWDYVILDEAHKIKTSSTKTAKSAQAIPARHRILLTGTPVQNNLREMWALFDFACQGALLGTAKTFKSEYENPITRAREKDATPGERALGLKISENLMTIINPHFLRRTKQEVQNKKLNATKAASAKNVEDKENKNPNSSSSEMPTLTRKNDLIVWTYLSAVQEDIYNQFISLEHIKDLLMTTRSPLAELNILKKLCDHPRLLSARAVAQLGLEEGSGTSTHEDDNESAASRIENVSDETLVLESGKLTFLVNLLERLRVENCRTLVFSQSRKMLDIIERVLVNKGFKLLRVDGTVIHLPERERRIALFQTNKQYSVFLLTTQVGGVGITLTAANRVVIFDPSWNPATDAQAVDRAYRIGQTENVVIYRLITCGTVEEKIYRRQVFKDSLIRQTTGDKKNPFRYFSRQELKELFKLEDTRSSSTQLHLQTLHSRQRRTDPELDEHIAYLHTMEMFGLSDHDLMFSHDAAVNEDHPEDQQAHLYIENRVLKAHELMKAESELHGQLMNNVASNTEPAFLRNPGSARTSTEKYPVKVEPTFSPLGSNSHNAASPQLVDLTQSDAEEEFQNVSNKLIDLVLGDSNENTKESSHSVENDDGLGKKSSSDSDQSLVVVPSTKIGDVDISVLECENMSLSVVGDENILPVDGAENIEEVAPTSHQDGLLNSSNPQNTGISPKFQSLSFHLDQSLVEVGPAVKSVTNLRLSILQKSDFDNDSHGDASSKMEFNLESSQVNFNLQLEDSNQDLFPENEKGVLEESCQGQNLQMETSLHAELELSPVKNANGQLDVAVSPVKDTSICSISDAEASFVHSVRKKKKAHVIYDSEDEDENIGTGADEKLLLGSSPLQDSFKGVGFSTPKHERSAKFQPSSTPHRKSIGGNVSVASRRSFVDSVMEDVEDLDEEMETEQDEPSNCSGSAAEITGSGGESVVEEEEPSGETLNTEEYEEGSRSEPSCAYESEGAANESLEESTGDLELSSGERMEQCAQEQGSSQKEGNASDIVQNTMSSPEDEYESLVKTGKECHLAGKFKEALDFFVKALDIRNGDPEIQLMTIQLYRRLSQP